MTRTASPLRNLTKKNAKFAWKETHQNAFKQLTEALSSSLLYSRIKPSSSGWQFQHSFSELVNRRIITLI